MKRRSAHQELLEYLDSLVRALVLDRDGHRCLKCGSQRVIQAAHIFPKGQYPGVRFHLQNVMAMCARCHIYGPDAWHKHPFAAVEWATQHFGETRIRRLRLLAQATKRRDLQAIRLYLEAEMERRQIPLPAT